MDDNTLFFKLFLVLVIFVIIVLFIKEILNFLIMLVIVGGFIIFSWKGITIGKR